jgi:peptide-methionine (S)-S-oxide reductase
MDGVIRTRVGYAGGDSNNPTYYNLGNHSETIQIEYDPTKVSYKDLLDVFWDSHLPTHPAYSQQYASIIFYHNEEQRKLAEESKEMAEARLGHETYTSIVPFTEFYVAEDYHQKYYLKNEPGLITGLHMIYHDESDITDSTAAARFNGYVAGNGSLELLKKNLSSFGLSKTGEELLLQIGNNRLVWSQGNSCPIN